MTHITCRLTAKNRDQLRNPTLGNRLWARFFILGVLDTTSLSSAFYVSRQRGTARICCCAPCFDRHSLWPATDHEPALSTRAHWQNMKVDWIYSIKQMMTQSYGWNLQRLQHLRNSNNRHSKHKTSLTSLNMTRYLSYVNCQLRTALHSCKRNEGLGLELVLGFELFFAIW